MYMGQFVIMSVTTDAIRGTHEEYEAWQEFCDLLDDKGLFYLEAEGCYKGEKERSLVIQLHGVNKLPMFLQWAKDFKQESILWVDSYQRALLVYPERPNHSDDVGRWQEVDESTALAQDAWTKVGDLYYICE